MTIRWMRLNPGGREAGGEEGGLLIVFLDGNGFKRFQNMEKGKSFGGKMKGKRDWGGCHQGLLSQDSPLVELKTVDFLGCRLTHPSLGGNRADLPVHDLEATWGPPQA